MAQPAAAIRPDERDAPYIPASTTLSEVTTAAPEPLRAGFAEARATGDRHGLLFAAGLITGEALVGILLAIPIVATGDRNALAFWGVHDENWPGVLLLAAVMFGLYRVAAGPPRGLRAG